MWTENGKIIKEASQNDKNKVIVNVPDFEGQFFGKLQKRDKPYSALMMINDKEYQETSNYVELRNILYGEITNDFPRLVIDETNYRDLAYEYAKTITDDIEKWKIEE